MKIITEIIDIYNENEDANIQRTADYLKSGKNVAIPTETVYGLAGNIFDDAAIKNIFVAKGRPSDNPLIVHVSSMAMAEKLIDDIPKSFYDLAKVFWPGTLTMILNKTDKVSNVVSGGLGTVAVRIPQNKITLKIIERAGVPLAAPSANLSGSPSPTSFLHVKHDLMGRVDAIVRSHSCDVGIESTVISLAGETPVLLRPGVIPLEALREVVGALEIHSSITEGLKENQVATSPGMKYKHYAPKTNLILVEGTKEDFYEFTGKNQNCGIIGYDNDVTVKTNFLSLGNEDDENEICKNIFSALRDVDELGVETAYLRLPKKYKEYLGFYNRILRASEYQVITLWNKLQLE